MGVLFESELVGNTTVCQSKSSVHSYRDRKQPAPAYDDAGKFVGNIVGCESALGCHWLGHDIARIAVSLCRHGSRLDCGGQKKSGRTTEQETELFFSEIFHGVQRTHSVFHLFHFLHIDNRILASSNRIQRHEFRCGQSIYGRFGGVCAGDDAGPDGIGAFKIWTNNGTRESYR